MVYSANMKLSVEYAHIYTNSQINDEHELSLKILKEILETNIIKRDDVSLCLMVDDYSFPDPDFNYQELVGFLTRHDLKPDILIRESILIKDCDYVISLIIDEDLRKEIADYIREKKKYPCSLFIATWYLVRLGCIKSDIFDNSFCADRLVNILPESFKPFEEKGFDIINNTSFKNVIEKIENKYFQGRAI